MDHLTTETRNPASAELDLLSTVEFAALMNSEDAHVIDAVRSQLSVIAQVIDVIADRLKRGGRLVYLGAGTSGRLGVLDASECPPTFNSPAGQIVGVIAGGSRALTTAVEGAEDHPEQGRADLEAVHLGADDILVGIATSGRTPYVIGGLQHARAIGAVSVGLACVPDSELAPHADHMIVPVVGPEVLTGSTRLKAGTATKLVLNMLTTGAMVRLGKTYGNLMVDLRATNVKLKARTNRIIRAFLDVDHSAADRLLDECGGELKTALVAGRLQVAPVAARAALQAAEGNVRAAVEAGSTHDRSAVRDMMLGIDGGGTKVVAVLARRTGDTWVELGRGHGGSANVRTAGVSAAGGEIRSAVEGAFRTAGLKRSPVGIAVVGLAGAGRSPEREAIQDWLLRARMADQVDVCGDVELLLDLLPDRHGIAVVAGTGSCVMGRSADGRIVRAGGYGPAVSDEGSGYRLVLDAVQAVLRSADGRAEPTQLTAPILHAFGVTHIDELVGRVNGGWDRRRIASLAPVVLAAADRQEPTARECLFRAADSLAECVHAVHRQMGGGADGSECHIVLAGGLVVHGRPLRERLLSEIRRLTNASPQVRLADDPVLGALHRAMRSVNHR